MAYRGQIPHNDEQFGTIAQCAFRIAFCIAFLLSVVCINQPVQPDENSAPSFRYTVSVPTLDEDSIAFTLTVDEDCGFILPYHFYDNPLDSINGSLVRDLSIVDAQGDIIDTSCSMEQIGPIQNRIVHLPAASVYPVTITYRLDLSVVEHAADDFPVPLVHANGASLFFTGAYCFILPEISSSLTTLWRTSFPVKLTYRTGSGINLYGIRDTVFTCQTLYELLFLQMSAGPDPIVTGSGGGIAFQIVDFTGQTESPGMLDSMKTFFGTVLDNVTPLYGVVTANRNFTIGIHDMSGALEGTWGFVMTRPDSIARRSVFEVLAHEYLHCYMGIQCGEYNDQWWKEAAATYLALEMCVRLGWYEKTVLEKKLAVATVYSDPARFQRALSDPWLRAWKYPEQVHGIVYDRGAKVMMLLDVKVRSGSDNTYTLHDVMGDLCKRFKGRSFYRADFLEALERFGAGDCSAFFTEYVDNSNDILTTGQLQEAFDQLSIFDGF